MTRKNLMLFAAAGSFALIFGAFVFQALVIAHLVFLVVRVVCGRFRSGVYASAAPSLETATVEASPFVVPTPAVTPEIGAARASMGRASQVPTEALSETASPAGCLSAASAGQ